MRSRLVAALRWLGARRLLLPLTARLLCACTVRESLRFLARELVRAPGVQVYTLRENGARVAIRHSGVDAATLAEVFYHRYYDPPARVLEVLGEPAAILDLGANIGTFGAFALTRWPSARILAYEPDPTNAALHERTIAANQPASRWSLIRAAAGARDGEVQFAGGLDVASHVVEQTTNGGSAMISVAMHDVLEQIAGADLVKMDIEGGEWPILLDPRFAGNPPRTLVLEYHPGQCPGSDPALAVERALKAAGLQVQTIWSREDGHGMLWAWRS